MEPRLSVILPVFNSVSTLKKSIQSILEQSYDKFELIVGDDGSSDHPEMVIHAITDDRLIFVSLPHNGLAATLNKLITIASGKYIARMDADDVCLLGRFKYQVSYLDTNPDVDVVAGKVILTGDSRAEGIKHYIEWQNKLLSPEEIYKNRFVDSPIVHPSVMFRKSVFLKYGGYTEESLPEDFELWLRWMDLGVSIAKVNKPVLYWHDSPTRLTRSHRNYDRDKFFKLKAIFFSKWFQKIFQFNLPEIWVCGTGTKVFKRTQWLKQSGLEIEGYIDIKKRASTRKIISYEDIVSLVNPFILSYVSDRIGRVKIHKYLLNLGLKEVVDFYMMA